MDEIATLVSAGGAGALLAGFLYLLNANRLDRRQYHDTIARATAQAEVRADAADARAATDRALAEDARRARFECEDGSAKLRTENAALRAQLHRRDGGEVSSL